MEHCMRENSNQLHNLVACVVGSVRSLNVDTPKCVLSLLCLYSIVSAIKLGCISCLSGINKNIFNFALPPLCLL